MSRIAAMTGISRKEIKKVRDQIEDRRWTPAMEISPANLLLHYWHFDEDFSENTGVPASLPIEGPVSFSELARRYAGDIPVGALKEELKRAAVVSESNGFVTVEKRYFQPEELDQDFIRNIVFSLRNLACTVVHNAELVGREDFTQKLNEQEGRFERFAWSDQLSVVARKNFRSWVRNEGKRFIEDADHWIGENELNKDSWGGAAPKSIGVGIYYFEED